MGFLYYSFTQYLILLLNQNIYKYSYGRGVKEKTYMTEILRLPICYEEDGITPKIDGTRKYSEEGYIPDFKWMENYVKKLLNTKCLYFLTNEVERKKLEYFIIK